jgi:outer membrane protein assembly factor BamD
MKFLILLLTVLTAGCANLDKDPTRDWSPQRLYTEGKSEMANGNYETAIKYFEKIEARYPYGAYAEQAVLETSYAYYKSSDMSGAIAAANRFLRLYPTHPNADYALYLRGIASFNENRSLFDKLFGAGDHAERDPKALRDAFDAFRELTERFPNSRYADDARSRLAFLVNALARHEIHVARYYYERGAYVAAANRAKTVIEAFPQTPAIEDALGLQVLAYRKMGMTQLADDARRVLTRNFPASRYLRETEKKG